MKKPGHNLRHATPDDAAGLNEIGNYYIENSAANFKLEPLTLEERCVWLSQFSTSGRLQLIVSEYEGQLTGYACTGNFYERRAYDSSVTTTVYLHPDFTGMNVGTLLYNKLFELLSEAKVHRAYAGITQPNEASMNLHRKFGFYTVGKFSEIGFKFDTYHDVVWLEKQL